MELPSSVKISKVLITEGQFVTKGTALFSITADTLNNAKSEASKQLDQAQNTLVDAENNVSSMNDTVDKYTITAPISGQVITKKMKAGDKISNNSNSSNELALIYDLSELTFQMSIDELDISKVKVGQKVKVTADAFPEKTFSGHVSNVGLNGTASNGVTTYPVVVTMDQPGELLPGMNVDGVIILEQAEDTLYIPANALQRGDIVYVKDTSLEGTDQDNDNASGSSGDDYLGDAPEGFTAVKVETGIISNSYVEILSGLSEGQEVYVKDSMSGMDFGYGMYYDDGYGGSPPDGGGPGY